MGCMMYTDKQLGQVPTKYVESKDSPLAALLDNRCVALPIKDKKMRLKKRVQHPILMIAPTSVYGIDGGNFVFSMPGYGSEIIDIRDIKPLLLYRLGMTMRASNILANEIKSLFK